MGCRKARNRHAVAATASANRTPCTAAHDDTDDSCKEEESETDVSFSDDVPTDNEILSSTDPMLNNHTPKPPAVV